MIQYSEGELDLSIDGERRDRTPARAPGRTTLTSRLPASSASIARAVIAQLKEDASVQARGDLDGPDVHAVAAQGTSGGGGSLPYLAEIQRAFGHHDVTGVRAHIGGAAADASAALGARAYAAGDDVAFAAAPDLHLAAHEAAHVVQQRAGVRLSGGIGAAGDEYERHADEVADAVCRGEFVEELLGGKAHRGAAGGPAVQRNGEDEETTEVNYVFFFTGGDNYGRAARAYIEENYAAYERRDAGSIEQMFSILNRDITRRGRGGGGVHIGHVVLVSHARVAQPTEDEAREGAETAGELYIAPLRGSDERVSAETLAQLQGDFREGLHARFRRDRSAVVGSAIDENTMIEVRGCRIAQSAETMSAMRDLFGGNAEVRAPTGYQGYAVVPWDEARTPLPQAIEILIEQGSVPATARTLPAAEQRRLVEGFVGEHGGLPTQHFVEDGTGDREAIANMTDAELTDELAQPGAGPHASRENVDLPDTGNEWGYAGDPDARDPALERLPREELERRARALLADYQPEDAPELQRLRNAWSQVTFRQDDDDPDDPIAGIPPEDIFGDPSVIDRDAARVRRGRDRFEDDDIEFTEPTERQRNDLNGEPDTVSEGGVEPEPEAAAADAPAADAPQADAPEARPRRRSGRRPRAQEETSRQGEREAPERTAERAPRAEPEPNAERRPRTEREPQAGPLPERESALDPSGTGEGEGPEARGLRELSLWRSPRLQIARIGEVQFEVRGQLGRTRAGGGDEGDGDPERGTITRRGPMLGGRSRAGVIAEENADGSWQERFERWCEGDFSHRLEINSEEFHSSGGRQEGGVEVTYGWNLGELASWGPCRLSGRVNLFRNRRGELRLAAPSITLTGQVQHEDDGMLVVGRIDATVGPTSEFLVRMGERIGERILGRAGRQAAQEGAEQVAREGAEGVAEKAAERLAREGADDMARAGLRTGIRGGLGTAAHVAGTVLEPIMILVDFYICMEHIASIIPGIERDAILHSKVNDFADIVASWVYGGRNQHQARVDIIRHRRDLPRSRNGEDDFLNRWSHALTEARTEAQTAIADLRRRDMIAQLREQYRTQEELYHALGAQAARRQGVSFSPDDVIRHTDGSIRADGENQVPANRRGAAAEAEARRRQADRGARSDDENLLTYITIVNGEVVIDERPVVLECGVEARVLNARHEGFNAGRSRWRFGLEVIDPMPDAETVETGEGPIENRVGAIFSLTAIGEPEHR